VATSERDLAGEPLAIDLDPTLRHGIERVAEAHGISLLDSDVETLRLALAAADQAPSDPAWNQLSAPAFARDWGSDADAVYDDLA